MTQDELKIPNSMFPSSYSPFLKCPFQAEKVAAQSPFFPAFFRFHMFFSLIFYEIYEAIFKKTTTDYYFTPFSAVKL